MTALWVTLAVVFLLLAMRATAKDFYEDVYKDSGVKFNGADAMMLVIIAVVFGPLIGWMFLIGDVWGTIKGPVGSAFTKLASAASSASGKYNTPDPQKVTERVLGVKR